MRFSAIALGATSLLGACDGGARWMGSAPVEPPSSATEAPFAANCCARQKTLFVVDTEGGANFLGAAYAFDYDTGTLLKTLKPPREAWNRPSGACSDDRGHVYIANTLLGTVDEYNHAGRYVLTISVPGQYPLNCAFDRSTGSLAIASFTSQSGEHGHGSVVIYKNGKSRLRWNRSI
ncbi:MAG: SMP-30/gluconolactonase/LRE family protein [Candidatus Tumulicola sp.]